MTWSGTYCREVHGRRPQVADCDGLEGDIHFKCMQLNARAGCCYTRSTSQRVLRSATVGDAPFVSPDVKSSTPTAWTTRGTRSNRRQGRSPDAALWSTSSMAAKPTMTEQAPAMIAHRRHVLAQEAGVLDRRSVCTDGSASRGPLPPPLLAGRARTSRAGHAGPSRR